MSDESTEEKKEKEISPEGPVVEISHNVAETTVDAGSLLGNLLAKKIGKLGEKLANEYDRKEVDGSSPPTRI